MEAVQPEFRRFAAQMVAQPPLFCDIALLFRYLCTFWGKKRNRWEISIGNPTIGRARLFRKAIPRGRSINWKKCKKNLTYSEKPTVCSISVRRREVGQRFCFGSSLRKGAYAQWTCSRFQNRYGIRGFRSSKETSPAQTWLLR